CKQTKLFYVFVFLSTGFLLAQGDAENEVKQTEIEKRQETILYGLDSEVAALIETLIIDDDEQFSDSLISIFNSSSNTELREKIINYCIHFNDNALKDFAITVIEDPFDENRSTVSLVCKYIEKLEINETAPALQEILETENEDLYEMAISALSIVGGSEQAVFLANMFDDEDLDTIRKQQLVKALGALQVLETWDKLVERAEDENENLYVRMYAAEAIGQMKKPESIDVLIRLFDSTDPNLRQYVLKGLSHFTDEKVQTLIISAVKDNYWKVRQEAISIIQKLDIIAAAPYLLYRAKNDSEKVIVYDALEALASLGDKKGIEYLIEIVKDDKKNDVLRSKSAESLLKNKVKDGYKAVIVAAEKSLEKSRDKNLRYALGKLFVKYPDRAWGEICEKYLHHDDVATKGTGLDIYNKNTYSNLTSLIEQIAEEDKSSAIKTKAKRILESKKN
ncbi:MAG TPA: HEAT repeat domain-containing protein, partial [Treponemataceae bacterium]|nr:HEAT repeat domain-containing protein [Treponemataceae bacterium]